MMGKYVGSWNKEMENVYDYISMSTGMISQE